MRILMTCMGVICMLAGCNKVGQENYDIEENGTEWGVEIDVLLKEGGSATLVCPKFDTRPRGAHGRECYIRSIEKVENGLVPDSASETKDTRS